MKRIIIVLLFVLLLTGCKNEHEEIILEIPTNITQNGETLSWDSVENATSYSVSIGSFVKNTVETSISLLEFENGTYDVKVMANAVYDYSEYSEIITITINRTYDIPQNLVYVDDVITWNEMPNAISYNLQINGEAIEVTDNSYAFTPLSNVVYEINVQAVYQTGSSSMSSTIHFHTFEVVNESHVTSFNRLLPIGLEIVLPESIILNALYINQINYTTDYVTIDGSKLTFNNDWLTLFGIGEHTFTLITETERIDIIVNIFEDDKPTLVSSSTITYSGSDITFKFALFGAAINTINGADITSDDYIINGDELTIKASFIDAILTDNPDRETVIFSYTLKLGDKIIIGYLFIETQTD